MKFDIVDNYDSITCRICGFNSKRLCGEHLSMHNITQQEYKEVFKDAPIICPEHIKYLSDSSMGSNNINHKSKTTEEERKSRSPFSKLFYTHDLMDEERISFINSIEREYTTTLEYYLNRGYSEEESKRMLAERQTTFSLEKCIHKHGEELGYKIWEERQSKWMKSLHTNGNLNGGFSNISQNLFVEICEVIGYEGVNFFRHNGEKIIGRYSIDFTRGNKVIEFNGDLYHGNPKFYESTDNPNPFNKEKTSQDIWDKDERKIKYLSDLGYKVLVVWESEYKNNSLSVLNKCLDFLKNDSII
jgi:G:T-mismatch repair DNA endonuclease (very short patch repair protein)